MWDNLKASIASVVRTNNNQEITGANLQNVLNTIVNTVGANATFAGIAVPSTNPGIPDGPVFYIACEPGVYSNFNLTLVDGLYILENKTGSWVGTQINTGAAFEALISYYNAVLNGASITVPDATTYRLTVGGDFKLKMLAPGTTATTLTIGNATNIPIWYNGAAVSEQNTWEANEIISVFYDGTRFMASNSQGGGGKAEKISYNNLQSGLAADNVQEALDELSFIAERKADIDSVFNTGSWNLSFGGDFTWILGTIHSADGKAWNSSSYYHVNIPVTPGLIIKLKANNSYRTVYAFLKDINFSYSNSGTDITSHYADEHIGAYTIPTGNERIFVIPEGCNYLYLDTGQKSGVIYTPAENFYYTPKWKEDIDELKEKVLPEVSLLASFTDGHGISPTNGNLSSDAGYAYSNYIDVSDFNEVEIGILDSTPRFGYALYDEDYQYIRGGTGTGKTWSYINTVINTQDAYYLRLTSVATTESHFAEMGYPIVKAESSPLTKNAVMNNLETEEEGYVLDARQGKVLKDLIVNGMTLLNLLTSPCRGWWSYKTAALNSDLKYGTNATFMDTDKDLYITADSGYELTAIYLSGGKAHGVDQDGNMLNSGASTYYKSIIVKTGNKWNVQARMSSLSEITNINDFFSHFKVTYKKEEQDEEVKDAKEANPLFETFASYNAKNNNALSKEIIFSTSVDSGGGSLRRIPSIIVTNNKTVIAATEVRSAYADNAQTGIILARKTSNASNWVYNLVLPYSASSYGKVMNPCFIVDRNGVHGTAGRIYLFFVAFVITSGNDGWAYKCTTSEIDNMYIYSDDDGITWSSPISTKSAWNTSDYIWMAVSPANGAIMDDGTFVLPCMGYYSNNWYSGVMYKTPSGSWTYSKRTLIAGDNESTVFVYDGDAYLNCRNEKNGHIRTLYKLDMSTNDLVSVEYDYDPNIICQQSICKGTIGGNSTFFQTANDPLTYNIRNRLTVWASKDGMKWARLIRVNDSTTYGYSVADCYDGKLVVIYENNGTISYIDLSSMATLIGDVYKRVLDKDIEQRLHELVERIINN